MTSSIRLGRDRRRAAAALATAAEAVPVEPVEPVEVVEADRPGRGTTALFGGTLLLGAALLFAVQPMFARLVLPVLGGTSAVWATSMVFFQAALLAAYAYAHWSVRRLGSRRQAVLHVVLLVPPLLVLPAGIPAGWVPPTGGQPGPWLLGLLAVGIGPPFVAVAATAPLLQRWYADSGHRRGADPYFLYRASNLGSIVGLVGYPLVLEPTLPLKAQGELWRAGYVLLALLVTVCAVVLWRSRPVPPTAPTAETAVTPEPTTEPTAALPAGPDVARGDTPAGHSSGRDRLRWLALAFVPSALLIGVTNVLTTDLAPIPLLWVLPLAVYLGTFVVAFSSSHAAARAWLWSGRLLPALAGVVLWVLLSGVHDPLTIFIPLHLITFGVAALFCHGRLAAERPPADALTGFYLTLAAGGALGGVAAGLLAPVVFDHLLEYPLGLVLAVLALPAAARVADRLGQQVGERAMAVRRAEAVRRWVGPVAVVVLIPVAVAVGLTAIRHGHGSRRLELLLLGAAVLAALVLPRRRPPVRAVAVGAVFLVATSTLSGLDGVIFADRSFYGTLVVQRSDDGAYHVLQHGTTIHGAQATDPARRTTPLTYFTLSGPAGDVVRAARAGGLTRQVAVVGLGAGAMACHAQPGERFTFYEIDPLVQRIANDPGLFSYLRDCPGSTDVVLGDARVSLSRQPDARFGLLMLDAFSSDVVPVHLLTRQAVELYRSRLEPGGLVAFHVSNRYLDLEPVLGRVATALGMTCASRLDPERDATANRYSSHWLALAATPAGLGPIRTDARWRPCRVGSGRVWTDDYTNVIGTVDW